MSLFSLLSVGLLILFLSAAIKVLGEHERGVAFRLERVRDTKGPGLIQVFAPLWGTGRLSGYTVGLRHAPWNLVGFPGGGELFGDEGFWRSVAKDYG